MAAQRVVSLLAAGTEIVAALGLEERLVGRSHECDFPAGVLRLPVCTAPRLDPAASSAEIDRQVRARADLALSLYDVRRDELRALRPDLLITQVQCEVCAVSLRDVEEALGGWLDPRPEVVSLSAASLSGLFDDVRAVSAALGEPERGERLAASLKEKMAGTAERARSLAPRPRAACLEWLDPLMAAGNWMPELVEMAGGLNLFGSAGLHSPYLDWPSLSREDPDAVILLPCGFDLARTLREAPVLTGRAEWGRLKAARQGRIYAVDGNQYFNRPGPRLAESLDILAEILHPEAFGRAHEGKGWSRV